VGLGLYRSNRGAAECVAGTGGSELQLDSEQESITKVKQVFAVGVLALATGAVFADQSPAAPVTRAEVIQSVLAARAAGTLIPAGEGVLPRHQGPGLGSDTTRAAVNAEVLQARANGDLVPAGDGALGNKAYNQMVAARSSVTRDQVKSEVLEARANGTLIPAGEGEFVRPESEVHTARHSAPPPDVLASHTAK
jgi:hypothetical protein